MKIEQCKDYVDESDVALGIATEQPFKVKVERRHGENLKPLMDEIERTFKVYQYRKDNGVEHGKHELFYWTNDCFVRGDQIDYFDLSLNGRVSLQNRLDVLDRLLRTIANWDGRATDETEYDSYAVVDYHSVIIEDKDVILRKSLERLKEIGKRKCYYGGMTGFFHFGDPRGVLFRKERTRKYFYTDNVQICRAKEVA